MTDRELFQQALDALTKLRFLMNEIAAAEYVADRSITQPAQPLTDEQILSLWFAKDDTQIGVFRFARAIEQAHGIKGEKK